MNISVNLSNEIRASKDKKVLNKPFRTSKGPKKFSVYVKNDKGNVVKVNFGDPNMEIYLDILTNSLKLSWVSMEESLPKLILI